jgi:quercetin dioxygenase-like cupin family protein
LCELSPNTISLIERGVTSPSVSTLHRLAMALGASITSLFDDRVEKAKVILTRADERPRSGSASVALESLGAGLEEQACDPFLVTLKSGASSGKQVMVHTGHELVFCLQGALEYEVAGENYRLGEGDALLFHADLPHRWRNPNSTPAVFLLIMQIAEDLHESVDQHLHP